MKKKQRLSRLKDLKAPEVPEFHVARNFFYFSILSLAAVLVITGGFALTTSKFAYKHNDGVGVPEVAPFPLGVFPAERMIVEQPEVNEYLRSELAQTPEEFERTSWLSKLTAKLALFPWFQNLASTVSRVLVVVQGDRMEETLDNFSSILGWDGGEKQRFIDLLSKGDVDLSNGKLLPGNYLVDKDATPEDVVKTIEQKFEIDVGSRYSDEIAAVVPLEDALIIASLIEREAYGLYDMRQISGIIWNRLFADMKLQLDATIQYAKAEPPRTSWWPPIRKNDKFIDSPFNTYKYEGLPPAPIVSPSLEAVVAALNPAETECMFYFHTENGSFHCSVTYYGHVSKLRQFYGSGR